MDFEQAKQWQTAIPSYFYQTLSQRLSIYETLTFPVAVKYCGVPPVIPYFDIEALYKLLRKGYGEVELKERMCIVCGKIHLTSQPCGKEPSERKSIDEYELDKFNHYGHKLSIAKSMGFFEDR